MYGVDGRKFQRQYKRSISNFKHWEQKPHAEDWILYPENLSHQLSPDEVALSDSELYIALTSKKGKVRKGSIVAIIKGIKSDKVIEYLLKINTKLRLNVRGITLDMARFYETHRQKMFSQCHTGCRPISRSEISHRSVAGAKDKPPLGSY